MLNVDWNSALFIILNGTKEEHLDMLDGGIIQRLLEEKWKTFARVSMATSFASDFSLMTRTIHCAEVHNFRHYADGFGGLVVSMLASGTQVCGFKPGRSRRIFTGVKILSMPSFGGEVKESVPCPSFAACKRT